MNKRTSGRPRWRTALLATSVGLALAGCVVGPDFHAPPTPQVADETHPYTDAPVPAQTASAPGTAGAAQHFVNGQDIPALWWQVFRSPALDALIRESLAHSPTLASAQAALRAAQESYNAQAGTSLYPGVDAQFTAARQKSASSATGVPAGTVFNVFNVAANVSYTIDLFGGNRRELEALQSAVDYQRYQVEAAYVSLTANVVATAIQEASLRAQLAATHDVVDAAKKTLDILTKQVELGAVARGAILLQQTQIAQAEAVIPPLERTLAQTRHQLSLLVGRLPGDPGLPTFDLGTLQLPEALPVSVPSQLVQQRPDIRAAEALLHEASARVGVATAALYPQITLTGQVNRESFHLDQLFSTGTTGWSLAGGILQPIFNGGALQANKRGAIAAFDQAQWQYRETVLVAFTGVADALQSLDIDAVALQTNARAEEFARQSVELIDRQFRLGAVSSLAALEAQRSWLQTKVTLAQAQAARMADTAALFQALGGGWWNAGEHADISVAANATALTAAPAPAAGATSN
jgi:NodT family efflux transporter outer membrane factor (OMF) lipoprotein